MKLFYRRGLSNLVIAKIHSIGKLDFTLAKLRKSAVTKNKCRHKRFVILVRDVFIIIFDFVQEGYSFIRILGTVKSVMLSRYKIITTTRALFRTMS